MNSTFATRTSRFNLLTFTIAIIACLTLATPAQAAFHLWSIQQLYTDNSGNLQYIELFDSSGGQNFVNGLQIQASDVGNTQTHTFTIPGSALAGNTFNHALLFGTAGLQAAGGPAPDYTLPNNFLFAAGGSISFFGANPGPYSALPINGVNARIFGTSTDVINNPQNYAGQTGFVSVPEPATAALLAGFIGLGAVSLRNRKKAKQ